MKYIVIITTAFTLSFASCGESEKEIKEKEQKLEKEIEETSNDLFDSLEEDLEKKDNK